MTISAIRIRWFAVVAILAAAATLSACSDDTIPLSEHTDVNAATPLSTARPVPTAMPMPEPTAAPMATATPTPVPAPQPTATPMPTATAASQHMATPQPTAIPQSKATPTPTARPTPVSKPTATATHTPKPTATPATEETAAPISESTDAPTPGVSPSDATTPEQSATPTPSHSDREALVALYSATDGANWNRKDNWLSDRPIGDWYGVITDAQGRVVSLSLHRNNLWGKIPAELGNLSKLHTMSLYSNGLSGEIPAGLGSLANLELVWLERNQLTGCIPDAWQAVTTNDFPRLGLPLCGDAITDTLTTPPPRWIFAGGIPEWHRTILRSEMEYTRAFFKDRYGVEATDFTVMVGADYEALAPAYLEVVGSQIIDWGVRGWVEPSAKGGAAMTLMYGFISDEQFSNVRNVIAHEYFHVLQGQLNSGFVESQDGEIAWTLLNYGTPWWLREGLATWADYEYSRNRVDFRPFLSDFHNDGRYTPYRDISQHLRSQEASVDSTDLETVENPEVFVCKFAFYSYSLAFVASTFLMEQVEEDSYVSFWKLLGEQPTWRHAFEEAFGIGVDEFYVQFAEWLPEQLTPSVLLELQLRWPDIENDPYSGRISIAVEDVGLELTYGRAKESSHIGVVFHMYYDEGDVGTGLLSLWLVEEDACKSHLLGWYSNGELASVHEDATPVEFTGRSSTIEWKLPGRPDTLPRLEERKWEFCR